MTRSHDITKKKLHVWVQLMMYVLYTHQISRYKVVMNRNKIGGGAESAQPLAYIEHKLP